MKNEMKFEMIAIVIIAVLATLPTLVRTETAPEKPAEITLVNQ